MPNKSALAIIHKYKGLFAFMPFCNHFLLHLFSTIQKSAAAEEQTRLRSNCEKTGFSPSQSAKSKILTFRKNKAEADCLTALPPPLTKQLLY